MSTVFVLGAGASIPYGYPSGAELRQAICQITDQLDPKNHSQLGRIIVECGGIAGDELAAFGFAFSRSGIVSIDAFLAKRPQFANIGKLAIAACLCDREDPDRIFSDTNDDHWYRLLWNVMIQNANEPMDVARVPVQFVTFNYDRSLEFFFQQAIANSFNTTEEDAAVVLSKMNILHVYGSLGTGRPYGNTVGPETLKRAANGLHIIPEARENREFSVARNWFASAERICFLGYGFDPLNNDRLGLFSVASHKRQENQPVARIYASTYGRTEEEVKADRKSVCGDEGWYTFSAKNTMTLRQSPLLHD